MQNIENWNIYIGLIMYEISSFYVPVMFYRQVYFTICRGEVYFETGGQEEEKETREGWTQDAWLG